jgi:glycosyltransferase involved in cell wall biosynthesis
MRVAIVYDFFPHYRAAVMRELLSSSQHRYILVADEKPIDPSIKPWLPEDRERFVHAPYRSLWRKIYFQKGLIKLALRRDVDAVIYMAYANFISTWISAVVGRFTGKRILFWTHGWTRSESGPKAWIRILFYKLANGLLLYGHRAKLEGIAKGFDPESMHVIYNSLDYEHQRNVRERVDVSRLSTIKEELFGDRDRPMVICTARLTRLCRLDLLLEAQATLKAEGHMVNVLLVGDGPDKAALQKLAQRLGLAVKFYGACYDEAKLAEVTMAANVTVSPGKVGLTAMQSLAYGTPVITHGDFENQISHYPWQDRRILQA